ncbi:MAG: hypothetical protein M1818_000800 [Claussenomyces sp. TS43310]|nr:MAG: hypothetical protein M1818_000800 [Claussenomyces sp. TS43310]
MSAFKFSFGGDDIEEDQVPTQAAEKGTLRRPSNTAFPVSGQALLPAQRHDLEDLLSLLPSKISYSTLTIELDDGTLMRIPRRELWDVRVQLMAEDDEVGLSSLGNDDIKTGVYEGGFKSWESSVDLVKVLAARRISSQGASVLELGCGTALPSLALFQWQLSRIPDAKLHLIFADYNPTVLQLVTVPNILLTWAQCTSNAPWDAEGELEIDAQLLQTFRETLSRHRISLSFLSGAWGPDFVQQYISLPKEEGSKSSLLALAAETIYSPMALKTFAETLMAILATDLTGHQSALVAAKKVYFGVGGSIEDFCDAIRARKGKVAQVREESDGVRRAVVEVL